MTAARATATRIAACSRALLDRPLVGAASLVVLVCADAADTRGAWAKGRALARGGGGGVISLAEGSVYVALSLASASALVLDADPSRLVNRYVRPLLAALGKLGAPSMYGGRDFVASKKSPVAWVGVQHSIETGRAAFEAIVGVNEPIAKEARRAFLGREPKSLRDLGCVHDATIVARRIEEAYAQAYGVEVEVEVEVGVEVGVGVKGEVEVEVGAEVEVEVEVGALGARFVDGAVRVHGDFYASREVVQRICAGLAAGLDVDTCLARATDGALLVGLPSLEPLARVLREAAARSAG